MPKVLSQTQAVDSLIGSNINEEIPMDLFHHLPDLRLGYDMIAMQSTPDHSTIRSWTVKLQSTRSCTLALNCSGENSRAAREILSPPSTCRIAVLICSPASF